MLELEHIKTYITQNLLTPVSKELTTSVSVIKKIFRVFHSHNHHHRMATQGPLHNLICLISHQTHFRCS